MVDNAIVPFEPATHNVIVQKNAALMELRDHMFKKGLHYGEPYKDAGKPTLLKPGAEIIMARFRLWPRYIERSTIEQWDPDHPVFHYRYECQLVRTDTGEIWGAGIGSCNSMEDKYRWRNLNRVCPVCGKDAIIKGRAEYGGGWLCYGKKGGCGKKWPDGAKDIEGQQVGRVPNDEVFTLVNTIDKMAQKRALVAAVLNATGASTYFTQDVEDFPGYAGQVIEVDDATPEAVIIDEHGEVIVPEVKPSRTEGGQKVDTAPVPEPPADLVTGRNGEDEDDSARETPPAAEDSADHWWHDPAKRQQFWITNKTARRTDDDVAALLSIPPSEAHNHTAPVWFAAMLPFANPGAALEHLRKLAKAQKAGQPS